MIFKVPSELIEKLNRSNRISIIFKIKNENEEREFDFDLEYFKNNESIEISDDLLKQLECFKFKCLIENKTQIYNIGQKIINEYINELKIKEESFEAITNENFSYKKSSIFEDTDFGRSECLLEINKKITETVNIQSKVKGTKNLIYYSVYFDNGYVDLFEHSINSILKKCKINFDILIITDDLTKKIIENKNFSKKINIYYHVTETPKNGIKASQNKCKVFEFKNINEYKIILYLDCDTVCSRDFSEIFNDEKIKSNTLYTYQDIFKITHSAFMYPKHGFEVLTENFLNEMIEHKQFPFNSGQFLFKNCDKMEKHFENVKWFMHNWCGKYFFEQSFMNYYFCKAKITENKYLQKYIGFFSSKDLNFKIRKPITHFVGQSLMSYKKLNDIKSYLKNIDSINKNLPKLYDYIKYPFQKFLLKINPPKHEVIDDSHKMLDLVKINHKSSYPDTILSKNLVCKKSKKMALETLKLKSISSGNKNLIYYTIAGNEEWIELLRMSLSCLIKQTFNDFEVLIITSQSFKNKIELLKETKQLPIHYMIMDESLDGVEASLNKLKIYQWPKIKDYNKVLFLDCDALAIGDLSKVFNLNILGNKLYTAWGSEYIIKNGYDGFNMPFHGLSMFFDKDFEDIIENEQLPFNAGQFLFIASDQMIKHFENVDWLAREWPGKFFFEQAFMSHYFCSNLLTNSSLLNDLVVLLSIPNTDAINEAKNIKNAPIYHYIGNSLNSSSKIEYITKFLKYANFI